MKILWASLYGWIGWAHYAFKDRLACEILWLSSVVERLGGFNCET